MRKTFKELFEELTQKWEEKNKDSSTYKLLNKGTHSIVKKILEEAAEVWMAAEYQSKEELSEEISQLLYHIQVLMLDKGLTLEDIYKYL